MESDLKEKVLYEGFLTKSPPTKRIWRAVSGIFREKQENFIRTRKNIFLSFFTWECSLLFFCPGNELFDFLKIKDYIRIFV